MDNKEALAPARTYWLGGRSAQKLHSKPMCSITRRSNIGHFKVKLTPEQVAQYEPCGKCM